MSKIKDSIKTKKKAFVPFLVAGYPDLTTTLQTMQEMADNGASVIEIGVPFSDPVAEGPVISAADEMALKAGITITDAFQLVADFRKTNETPVVFLTYANVVFHYGYANFFAKAEEAGLNGIIIPDIPYEEQKELQPYAKQHGVDIISLIAPTSMARVEKLAKDAEGYIYLVSSPGVTGERECFSKELQPIIAKIRSITDTPILIGFGISDAKQAKEMAALADGAIIGSAIVRRMTEYGVGCSQQIGAFTKEIVDAISHA